MSKVILDDETLAKLDGFARTAEVYDTRGNLVGYCMSVDAHLHSYDLGGPDPFSDADASAQLKTRDPGRPLKDILRDLRGE